MIQLIHQLIVQIPTDLLRSALQEDRDAMVMSLLSSQSAPVFHMYNIFY